MMADTLLDSIYEILNDYDEEKNLSVAEKRHLAELVELIMHSNIDIRMFFYTEISNAYSEIKKHLNLKREEIFNELMGIKNKTILN